MLGFRTKSITSDNSTWLVPALLLAQDSVVWIVRPHFQGSHNALNTVTLLESCTMNHWLAFKPKAKPHPPST